MGVDQLGPQVLAVAQQQRLRGRFQTLLAHLDTSYPTRSSDEDEDLPLKQRGYRYGRQDHESSRLENYPKGSAFVQQGILRHFQTSGLTSALAEENEISPSSNTSCRDKRENPSEAHQQDGQERLLHAP